MAVLEKWFGCELLNPVKVRPLPGNYFNTDNNGNKIGVEVTYNGAPVTLSGSVKGYAVRADGSTVTIKGSKSENKASITIPSSALLPGALLVTLVLVDGIQTTTLAAVSTFVM
jgi:hypothetical protein